MAIDTRNKRFAMLGLAAPFRLVMPTPDGSFSPAADRQQLAYSYPGIAFATPPATFRLYAVTYAEREAYAAGYAETNAYTVTLEQ